MREVCKVSILGLALLSVAAIASAAPAPQQTLATNLNGASVLSLDPTASLDSALADPAHMQLTARAVPQELPIEAIPTPTAVSSGLVSLAGLAAWRIFRKARLA